MTLNGHSKKTNLSKIASKEVKIYVFENYFLKKRSCATVTNVSRRFFRIQKRLYRLNKCVLILR